MREILFRGKRIDNVEWVYGYYMFKNGKFAIWDNNNISFYKINPETVGQFTGLTDKNGVKIFEGDIVKHWAWKNKFEIAFSKNSCFMCYSKNGLIKNIHGVQLEVIGNIHDNSELL